MYRSFVSLGRYTPKLQIFLKLYLFIYFCLCRVFIDPHGLSVVVASRDYSLFRCAGFSLWWLCLLQSIGSRLTGFSGYSTWLQ